MGAKLVGEIALEVSGSPAEIGLDVASRMLRPVVAGAVEVGMKQDALGDLLMGMLCGVCAEFCGHLELPEVVRRVRVCAEILQEAPVPPKSGGFAVPEPGTVQ